MAGEHDITAEEHENRRRELRREYRDLYERLATLLFEEDPLGLNFGDNRDEYDPEVDAILPRLKYGNAARIRQIRSTSEFDEGPQRMIDGVRLRSGGLQDDTTVVICRRQ